MMKTLIILLGRSVAAYEQEQDMQQVILFLGWAGIVSSIFIIIIKGVVRGDRNKKIKK